MSSIFSYAVPMIILLGLLIFVHELGHFLVAKYYKVRVEVFSLGFGKKLFSFRRGETEYCIAALPLGGYVKMYGDDPSAEVSEADRRGSFLHKPVGQRIAIILAGPLMNLLFAFVLYTAIAMMGERAIFPGLGDIDSKSMAATIGFQSGDTVLEVTKADGTTVKPLTWNDFEKPIQDSPEQNISVKVQRASGEVAVLEATPKFVPNPFVLGWKREVGGIDGLTFMSRASSIAVISSETAAAKAGLRTGDTITKIGETPIRRWRELLSSAETFADQPELKFTIQRGLLESFLDEDFQPQTLEFTLAVPAGAKGKAGLEALRAMGFDDPELYLASVEKGSPAEKAGLKPGDKLQSISDTVMTNFEQVIATIRTFNGEKPLKFDVLRDLKPVTIEVVPNVKKRMNNMGQEESRFEVGIRPMMIDDAPQTVEKVAGGVIQAMERGAIRSAEMSGAVVMGFVRLFQGEVSSKNIGGFLSIGQMAKRSWGMGMSEFFLAMAVISINLFVLNLLPVPVLDGGHLVFYTIEAIRGAPLSMQKMEIAQRVGAALLVGLMVFALFNDVSRIFFR
ncbi:MAG: RIP metalloprotease RseP [Deltaproteobacteria bacterium]|nr:RIP metalloprotease RseP [Deltaproteobacteria bacterium]